MSDLLYSIFGGIIFPIVVFSYENIALNKPAWQQDATYNFLAYRAVDGRKKSLSPYGHDCMTSSSRKAVEWRVDLEDVVSIHHILIQFATNNEMWDKDNKFIKYFLGFSVYLSNTTHKEDGILCFRDTNYTRATIPNPINITCPHNGRYVIYYNNRTHPPYPAGYSNTIINALCEVEVYGCPSSKQYEKDCVKTCPNNCQEGKRNIFACIVGYFGPACEKEIQTHYVLVFGCSALGIIIFCSAIIALTRRLKSGKSSLTGRNASTERTSLQSMSAQEMQVRLENSCSNLTMNIYSEHSDLKQETEAGKHYSIAQFPCSFGDHDSEVNLHNYNHLYVHATPSQLSADVYDDVKVVL